MSVVILLPKPGKSASHFHQDVLEKAPRVAAVVLFLKQLRLHLPPRLENAVRTNIVGRNVCDLVTPPRPKRHGIQPLTIVQAQELLKAARGHHLETLLTMAIGTGMRRGELLALRWEDIDIETGSLSIRRSVNYVAGYGLVESEPKTPKSRRKIVLPPHIIAALKAHQVHQ